MTERYWSMAVSWLWGLFMAAISARFHWDAWDWQYITLCVATVVILLTASWILKVIE